MNAIIFCKRLPVGSLKKSPFGGFRGLLFLLLCSSCMSYEKCAERYGTIRPVEYRHPLEYKLPVKYVLPAEQLRFSFPATESSRDTTSAGGVRVSYRLDTASNEVNVDVNIPERVIRDTVVLRDTIAVQVGCAELVAPQRWYKIAWERYKNFSAVAFLLLLYVLHKVGKKRYGKA